MNQLINKFWKELAIFLLAMTLTSSLTAQVPVGLVSLEPTQYLNVDGLDILHVQGQVYMISGAGGNVTLQVGSEGVLLVDTGAPSETDRLMTAIRRVTNSPFRYVLNTHADIEHISGNGAIVEAGGGTRGPRPRNLGGAQPNQNDGVQVVSSENAFTRMILGQGVPAMTDGALPDSFFFTPKKEFFSNGEAIQMLYQPNAHSDGDVLVFFRESDVISTGDIFITTSYPIIDLENGGSIGGVIDALNNIIDLTIPERNQMGGTRVIPGHGRISNESDVVEYRDMVTIIRDRVRDLAAQGLTLDQIKARGVSLEYDGLYGATTGSWTTDMFIDAVYNGVTEQ
jgi:cyclase